MNSPFAIRKHKHDILIYMKKIPAFMSRGFTIVEVVVVIVVISLLATLGGAVYTNYRERSNNDTRASRAQIIAAGLERYYSQNNAYPSVPMMTAKGDDNTPQKIADLLGVEVTDITDPGAPSGMAISIVDYDDYASSTENVFRYRGLTSNSDKYDCNENPYVGHTATVASNEPVRLAALFPGFCEAFVLSYRDTISNEWKEIRSVHNVSQ